jgi:hypothetical protein
MKVLAMTCMRNEAPFVLEWVAWHRLIGFTDFVVFSNDCEDGTDTLLDALAAAGVLRHQPQTAIPGKSVQWQALQRISAERMAEGFDWALFSDVDEFVMVHSGDGLRGALAALPADVDALALPWRLFGASGVVRYDDQPVTAQFIRSAPAQLYHPIAGRSFKTLFRPDRFGKPGIHRPKRPATGSVPRWYDGAGQPLAQAFAESDGQIALPGLEVGRKIIELHHYSLRSLESFVVKAARGLANRQTKLIDLTYWVERNFNTVENQAALTQSVELGAEIAALNALPGVADLHARAVGWHRDQAARLIRTAKGYRLFCACLHADDSAVVSRETALALYRLYGQIA